MSIHSLMRKAWSFIFLVKGPEQVKKTSRIFFRTKEVEKDGREGPPSLRSWCAIGCVWKGRRTTRLREGQRRKRGKGGRRRKDGRKGVEAGKKGE